MIAVPAPASAGSLNQFIGFGDSTMDSGYFRFNPTGGSPSLTPGMPANALDISIARTVAAGGSGAFMGPGVVDTIQIAEKFGLSGAPFIVGGGGGTNFANGSAQTVSTTGADGYLKGLYNNVPIVTQIYNYLDSVNNHANPNALYMISYGGNDLFWLQAQNGAVAAQPFITGLANRLTAGVAALQAAGGRTIMVLNIYAYARVVGVDGFVSSENATEVQQAASYSAQVWSGLAAAGVNFVPADIEGMLRYVAQHPAPFGFTPENVLTANPACGATSGLVCSPSDLVSPDAERTHLWGDPAHLSTAGQTMEANYLYRLLTAPSEVSMLTESAVQGGLARVSSIQGQIELSGQQRGPSGVNAWITGGANTLTLNNTSYYPSGSGPIFRGSVGGDYQISGGPMRGLILGAAVTAGGANQSFSGGDSFNQAEQALSLYAAYRAGRAWGNAIEGYGFLQSHTARNVALDQFIDHNTGNTSGRSLGLALRGGGDFNFGAVTTGPVAGVILQQVRLDGFTETGATGVTALSFGSQTQGSAVSQLGWRGAIDLGPWQPFAEVAWNHEWAGTNRWITTSLTSIAAPPYVTLAAPIAKNWASAIMGASYRLTPQILLRGSLSTAVFNPQLASYGGDVGLNIAF